MSSCLFCKWCRSVQHVNTIKERSSSLAYAFRDCYPVTEMHTLIIPTRHVPSYFELTDEERNHIDRLIKSQREYILSKDTTVEGFNIGWNCGEVAGQTIFHAHVHLIPRRKDDIDDPTGGIRNVIPGKGNYK